MYRFDENLRNVLICLIVFSFFSFIVYCVYQTHIEYNSKIQKIIRNEYIYKFPDHKIITKIDDEITLK